MPSTRSDALHDLLTSMTERTAANPEMGLPELRGILEELSTLAAEPTGVTYEDVVAGGRPALWCNPVGAAEDRVVLYFHGGAFMGNSASSHRKVAAHLAKAAGIRALVPDFRLAPEHPFPAQLDDAVAAYEWLLANGFEAGNIATAGDSAGGNLATSTVLRLRDEGRPVPAAIVAMSPWYDLEATEGTLDTNAATDAFLSRPLIQGLSAMFLGPDGSAQDPLANPLHADPAGLPPVYLSAGGDEALLDNAQRFAALARAAGVDATLEVVPGMQHVHPVMAGRAPEADRTLTTIASWLRPLLGLA
ncbi:MAG: alpha/beta hydrolase [Umezawaea sp.]